MTPILGFRVVELLEIGGDFFLAFCVLCGAAFVFMRSPRAALFIALGGLGACIGVVFEYILSLTHFHAEVARLLYMIVSVGRHALLFGGLALGLRTLARLGPA